MLSGRGAREDWQITERERGKGFYRSKRKVENLKRYFEVVRETAIHVENFPVDY